MIMMMMMMIEPERLNPAKDTENRANPTTQIITGMIRFKLKIDGVKRTNKKQNKTKQVKEVSLTMNNEEVK